MKTKAIIITTVSYLLMACSRTCQVELEYQNGSTFKYKLKGWYK